MGMIVGQKAQAACSGTPDELSAAKTKNNTISFAPLSAVVGSVVVDYERRLSSHVSLVATPSISLLQLHLPGIHSDPNPFISKGTGAEVAFNFYTGGAALNGFFLSSLVGYTYAYADMRDIDSGQSGVADVHALKVGGRLGRQWFPNSWMVINLSGGGSYVHQVARSQARVATIYGSTETRLLLAGVVPDLKFGLGVRF